MTVLQARPFRSVSVETRAGALVVVKRFHHPNPLLARFDGARARREFAALCALETLGLSVPRPLGLEATEAGFEVHLEVLQDARSLQAYLLGHEPPPGGWAPLLARLGELLACLQAAGWEHGDLHPGNVLVDASGRPWLIDLQRARQTRPDPRRCLNEVVECAAVARESLPARLRRRFLVAWLRTLPGSLRPSLARAALAHALEQRARTRRAELVRTGLGRWLRESSRVCALEHAGVLGWLRRDLQGAALAHPPARAWLELRGRTDELRARWLGAARLLEHGLPAARPASFVPGARWSGRGARAAFDAPTHCAATQQELEQALDERGLALARLELGALGGGVYLLPPREPEDFVECGY